MYPVPSIYDHGVYLWFGIAGEIEMLQFCDGRAEEGGFGRGISRAKKKDVKKE